LRVVCAFRTFATAPTVTINQPFLDASFENIGFSDNKITLIAPWSAIGMHVVRVYSIRAFTVFSMLRQRPVGVVSTAERTGAAENISTTIRDRRQMIIRSMNTPFAGRCASDVYSRYHFEAARFTLSHE
jgi:hypothetical protein